MRSGSSDQRPHVTSFCVTGHHIGASLIRTVNPERPLHRSEPVIHFAPFRAIPSLATAEKVNASVERRLRAQKTNQAGLAAKAIGGAPSLQLKIETNLSVSKNLRSTSFKTRFLKLN